VATTSHLERHCHFKREQEGIDMGFLVVTDNSGAFRLNSDLIMAYGGTSNKELGYHTHFTMQNGSVLKNPQYFGDKSER